MKNSVLRARYEAKKVERNVLNNVYDIIERYVVPFRGEFFQTAVSTETVSWRNLYKFDDTAVNANNTLSASIHGNLTSSVVQWYNLRFKAQELNKDKDAVAWLNQCSSLIFMKLQESNFNLETPEAYLDLTSLGTTMITEEFKDGNLKFNAVPLKHGIFELDTDGKPIRFYREFNWTALQMVDKFGRKGVPREIYEESEKPDKARDTHKVLFCVYKRAVYSNQAVAAKRARKYGSKFFIHKSMKGLGEEEGYYEMPVFVLRWRKVTGSDMGYSPAMICLGDILTVNALVEMILKAGEKVIDPATLSTRRGVIGNIDLSAGGNTIVRDTKNLVPFESGARFDVSQLTKKDLQKSIEQSFNVDQLELKDSPAMTATEVEVRYELMQRVMGPSLGLLQVDWLSPMLHRTFMIMHRNGLLPDPPESVAADTLGYEVTYLGPLAQAQKSAKLQAVSKYMQVIAPIAEFDQDILDIPDTDEIGYEAAEALGVPTRSEKEIKKRRGERQQAQKTREMMALAESMGKSGVLQNAGTQGAAGGA